MQCNVVARVCGNSFIDFILLPMFHHRRVSHFFALHSASVRQQQHLPKHYAQCCLAALSSPLSWASSAQAHVLSFLNEACFCVRCSKVLVFNVETTATASEKTMEMGFVKIQLFKAKKRAVDVCKCAMFDDDTSMAATCCCCWRLSRNIDLEMEPKLSERMWNNSRCVCRVCLCEIWGQHCSADLFHWNRYSHTQRPAWLRRSDVRGNSLNWRSTSNTRENEKIE